MASSIIDRSLLRVFPSSMAWKRVACAFFLLTLSASLAGAQSSESDEAPNKAVMRRLQALLDENGADVPDRPSPATPRSRATQPETRPSQGRGRSAPDSETLPAPSRSTPGNDSTRTPSRSTPGQPPSSRSRNQQGATDSTRSSAQNQNDRYGLGTSNTQDLALRFSSTPNMIGDFFGNGAGEVSIRNRVITELFATGSIIAGAPGSKDAVLVFEADGNPLPGNDFQTVGVGVDSNGDGHIDTFMIAEPLAPNEVPTSPGVTFHFDGGKVVYTNSATDTSPADGDFGNNQLWHATYSFSEPIAIDLPAGGGLTFRRVKLSENNSPFPRDRIFFGYNFFNDVIGGLGDVNRYTFGIEKTMYWESMSFEVRIPFAATLDADQTVGTGSARNTEFGNVTVSWKSKLYETEQFLVSGGIGLGTPTGSDSRVFLGGGRQVIGVENDAVHLLPFLAMAWSGSDKWFMQSFAQLDIDLNGNPVRADLAGGNLPQIGVLNDASLLFLDLTLGYWMIPPDPTAGSSLAMAPVLEFHYSTTMQDADRVVGGGFDIGHLTNRFDVLNLTAGMHMVCGQNLTITPAISVPLREDDDEHFDYEVALQMNMLY